MKYKTYLKVDLMIFSAMYYPTYNYRQTFTKVKVIELIKNKLEEYKNCNEKTKIDIVTYYYKLYHKVLPCMQYPGHSEAPAWAK